MSRSYRKPYWTDGYGGKWRRIAKRKAEKRVRQSSEAVSGMYYKRISNSWDICDFKFFDPDCEKSWRVQRK